MNAASRHSNRSVTANHAKMHLQIGIEAMTQIGTQGEPIKHFKY